MIDNFPHNRDQFSIMVERGIFPDEFIIFKDDSNDNEVLVKRAEENGMYIHIIYSESFTFIYIL